MTPDGAPAAFEVMLGIFNLVVILRELRDATLRSGVWTRFEVGRTRGCKFMTSQR